MTPLHEPARHEALCATRWDEGAAREAVRRIARDAIGAFDADGLWPTHPLDEPDTPDRRHAMLYFGAGGVIWALGHLRRAGAIPGDGEFGVDFTETVATLVERNREEIDTWDDARGSYLMGDTGLRLLHWQHTRSAALADALFDGVEANLQHKTLEALWGSPGSLLASLHMAEATGELRWRRQLERGLRILLDAMVLDPEDGGWLWVQDLYGRRARFLGAGHGFAANVYPALRGAALLPEELVQAMVDRALQTLSATARHDGDAVNWPPIVEPGATGPAKWLLQDCHGAPGIVCRLAAAPRTPAWDALLFGGGEATWRAGPLVKGSGLCHGTAGNGFALLKLWQRSGDERWLDRARAFAMHAIEQVERFHAATGQTRHSLWTGDIGVALFAWACVDVDPRFPTLDVF